MGLVTGVLVVGDCDKTEIARRAVQGLGILEYQPADPDARPRNPELHLAAGVMTDVEVIQAWADSERARREES